MVLSMVTEERLARLAARTKERYQVCKLNELFGPAPGSVWITQPDPQSGKLRGPMVLVLRVGSRDVLPVASVSKGIDYAVEDDLILERNESGLAFPCIVRTGDLFPITEEDLSTCVGQLPDALMKLIHVLCGRLTRTIEQVMDVGSGVVRTHTGNLMSRMFYGSHSFGLPVLLEDDIRISLLRKATRERKYLSQQAKSNLPPW